MHRAIYEECKRVARNRTVLTYSDVAPLAGLDMSNPDDRGEIGEILGDISSFEHDEGRPLLSAVVIEATSKIPGHGFFTLAQAVGLMKPSDDKKAYYWKELQRVYDAWNSRR